LPCGFSRKKTFELPDRHFLPMLPPPVTFLRKLLAIALVLLMQGPAMLVQEVAWVNMLVTYTHERGLKRGVIETFDGAHPCKLCKTAEKLRQQKGDDPAEPAAPQGTRPNLAWGPMMIPAGKFQSPVPKCTDIPVLTAAWQQAGTGRGVDGPEPPPPKWG
jgi:hypothetical protein